MTGKPLGFDGLIEAMSRKDMVPRRPVGIATIGYHNNGVAIVCNDGTVWVTWTFASSDCRKTSDWLPIGTIPGCVADETT